MANGMTPEVKSALQLGVIAEFVGLAIGGVLAFTTGEFMWVYGFALAGSAVMLFLMHRAGAFQKPNDQP